MWNMNKSTIKLDRTIMQVINWLHLFSYRQLDGPDAPDDWQGNIDGLTKYKLGPGLTNNR